MMNSVSVHIQRAISDAIKNQVLPQIQNVFKAGSGPVTQKRWNVPVERLEYNTEDYLNRKVRTSISHELQFSELSSRTNFLLIVIPSNSIIIRILLCNLLYFIRLLPSSTLLLTSPFSEQSESSSLFSWTRPIPPSLICRMRTVSWRSTLPQRNFFELRLVWIFIFWTNLTWSLRLCPTAVGNSFRFLSVKCARYHVFE